MRTALALVAALALGACDAPARDAAPPPVTTTPPVPPTTAPAPATPTRKPTPTPITPVGAGVY